MRAGRVSGASRSDDGPRLAPVLAEKPLQLRQEMLVPTPRPGAVPGEAGRRLTRSRPLPPPGSLTVDTGQRRETEGRFLTLRVRPRTPRTCCPERAAHSPWGGRAAREPHIPEGPSGLRALAGSSAVVAAAAAGRGHAQTTRMFPRNKREQRRSQTPRVPAGSVGKPSAARRAGRGSGRSPGSGPGPSPLDVGSGRGGWAPDPGSLRRPTWAPRPKVGGWREGRAGPCLPPRARCAWLAGARQPHPPSRSQTGPGPQLLASGGPAGKRPIAGSHAPGSRCRGSASAIGHRSVFVGSTPGAVPTPRPAVEVTSHPWVRPRPLSAAWGPQRLLWARPGNPGEPPLRGRGSVSG